MKRLTRKQLLSRLDADYDKMYYSPFCFYTFVGHKSYWTRSCDRQMYLDVRHPDNVSTERLQEIHEHIVNFHGIG